MSHIMLIKLNASGEIVSAQGLPLDLKGRKFDEVFETHGYGDLFFARLDGETFTCSKIKVEDGYIVVLFQEHIHQLVENLPVGIFVLQEGRVVYVNRIVEETSGFSKKEIYSADLFKIISKEYEDKLRKLYEGCVKHGMAAREEVKLIRKDGSEMFVEVVVTKGHYNEKPAVVGVLFDISQRKEFENLFLTLANQTFTGVYIIQDGRFVFLNDFSGIVGYSSEELFEMNPFDLVHPEDREKIINNYHRRIRGEYVEVPYSFRLIAKNGEVRYVDVIATKVMYRGKPAVMGMLIDKTDERRAQEKLKMYERFFKEAKDMFFIIDEKGRFLDVNPRYAEILGYDHSELIGRTSRKIVFDDDLDILKENFKKVLRGESVKFTFRAKCKNGEKRVFEVVEWPVFRDGRVTGAEGVLRDITDRLKTEMELKKTNDLLKVISEINELIFRERDEYSLLSKVCKVLSKIRNSDSWAWIIESNKMFKATPLAPKCPIAEKAKHGTLVYERCSCPLNKGKCLAIPAKHNGLVFGVLVLCSVGELNKNEIKILEELGEDLGFAITSYRAERDRKIAFNLLLDNLEQFENLADRLRNPIAIIYGFIEIKNDIGCNRVVEEISKQLERIEEILDDLRLQEVLTYFILRGEKLK